MNSIDNYFATVLLPPFEDLVYELEINLSINNPAIMKMIDMGLTNIKIADIGCGNGNETMELLLKLHASEIVGIDIQQESIDNSLTWIVDRKLQPIQTEVQKMRDAFDDKKIKAELSANIKSRVEEILSRYGNLPTPEYRSGDITKGEESTKLPKSYYDLAYSRYVLYHIYCDDKQKNHPKTRLAIMEMVRIVRTGGLMIAYEPNTCSENDDTKVNLAPLLDDQQNIQLLETLELPSETIYIYRKD